VSDDHAESGIELKLQIWLRDIKGNRDDFIAVLQIPGIDFKNWRLASSFDKNPRFEIHSVLDRLNDRGFDRPVLVSVVEVLENSQQGRTYSVPAIVRLEPFDNVSNGRRQETDSSSEVLGGAAYWEIAVPLNVGRDGVMNNSGDGINKVVEGAPEIVQGVPHYQTPPLRVRRDSKVCADTVAGSIAVTLCGERLTATLSPSADSVLEGLSVFFRPLNLSSADPALPLHQP
jgi:hypothetical protein